MIFPLSFQIVRESLPFTYHLDINKILSISKLQSILHQRNEVCIAYLHCQAGCTTVPNISLKYVDMATRNQNILYCV